MIEVEIDMIEIKIGLKCMLCIQLLDNWKTRKLGKGAK